MFKDKVFLITGGTGSFGNAMVLRLLEQEVKEIRIFSRNEKDQVEMRRKLNNPKLNFLIGDIRDYQAIYKALEGVDYCIHAAALKHVDVCTKQPLETIKTNVYGSENVILSCIRNKVKKLVCLSTDKATNAETCYGSSKYLMEKMALGIDAESTEMVVTRYGNVLGSSGSVIPLFKKLASENKPLTITNRNITRFFMELHEAVDLVYYALEHGNHRDLIVYNNKGATVGMIADCISDNQVTIGLRCVEKNGEALLTAEELNHSRLIDNKYYVVNKNTVSDIQYTEPLTSENCERFTQEELKYFINKIGG